MKTEVVRGKMGKWQHLNNQKTREFMKELDLYFKKKVEIPRIYLGAKQTFETLNNEEALQMSRYLRRELASWSPGIPS